MIIITERPFPFVHETMCRKCAVNVTKGMILRFHVKTKVYIWSEVGVHKTDFVKVQKSNRANFGMKFF